MVAHARRLPRFAMGLVALLVLQTGCYPKVTAPPEPPYSVRRGDEAFRYQDYKGALANYHNYLDETQKDAYTARVLYKAALAEYRLGRYSDTLATLDQLQQRYPKGHWVQVDALRGDAERELDRPMAALKAWDEGWDIASDNDRRKLRQRITSLARGFDDVQLAQAQRVVGNEQVRILLEQQVTSRQPPNIDEPLPEGEGLAAEEEVAAQPSKTPTTRTWYGYGQGPPPQPMPRVAVQPAPQPAIASHATGPSGAEPPAPEPPAAEALAAAPPVRTLPAEIEESDRTAPVASFAPVPAADTKVHGKPKVACLLPLSGPSQELGARSLRGLQMLFGEHNDRLMVLDTGSDAATALRLFNQILRDPDVVLAIGPLRGDDAEAVASLARQAQLPLLLLSQHDGLAGGSVLQVGMTRSRLVATVLQYAMDKVHMRRFGILYPEDENGKQYLAAFRSEVERRGGTIVGTDAYSPRTPMLPAVTLKRWRNSEHLQGIFLPDDVTAAEGVVHFLQRDMPDITLLGVHGWEALGGEGSDGASGILFSNGFFSGSTRPGTKQFVAKYQATYGDTPGSLEAQAYDAGLLAQDALDAGARSRAAVLPALEGHGPIEGATGQLNVTRTGLDSQLFLLQVYDGKVEEVSDATS